MELAISIVAGLIVSALTGAVGWLMRGETYRKRVDAAPTKFTARLTELIDKAVEEGPSHARVNARAILAMRDSFRRYSISLSELLNSEMDVLAAQLNNGVVHRPMVVRAEQRDAKENLSNEELYETITVLQKAWRGKKDELDVTIRQLLALLGLDRA